MQTRSEMRWAVVMVFVLGTAKGAAAAPPAPTGAHPRLFLNASNLPIAKTNAGTSGTAAKAMVNLCQQTISSPGSFTTRGGSDGDTWPGAAVACAFAYQATGQATYLTQGIKYWKASLNDDQTLGDGLGCVPGVSTNWQSWNGNPPAPPVILTITHDTGYPIRWYGPYIALAYDWLHDAPGVDEALRAQTRVCLTNWVDYYTQRGYHRDEPGSNYNAGFVVGKALAAVAMGGEDGADGDRIWTETVDGVFGQLLVGQGLAGSTSALGMPVGLMVGGDWAEGWQYGPLSVIEYAAAARALEENGAPLPDMDDWTNSLIVRYIHGTVPLLDGQWVGGDFDSSRVYQGPALNQLDAVLLGPSSDLAASWAAKMKALQSVHSTFVWNALAELRTVTAADYRTQAPPPPPWFVARGTRTIYARTSWGTDAFWAVFSSPPSLVSDHQHFAAGNFVFSRGGDHLVVDPSNYGEPSTLETNAVGADHSNVAGNPDYQKSQTPSSQAELVWARGTDAAVYAARSDFASAFSFYGSPSDVSYAHRDWTFLPEGEVVLVDRLHLSSATNAAYINLHANTAGSLSYDAGTRTATGTVGTSKVAIHAIYLSSGTPTISSIAAGTCKLSCNYPCGSCQAARFNVDLYSVAPVGPWAVAIHVIDGLAAAEAAAQVGSLNDDVYDPPPKQNGGVIGAAVYRGSHQTYVVASSGVDGLVGATMTYGVPGGSASRHVVFDAPEDASGQSTVSASAASGRCVLSIAAGAGLTGRPLMFSVGAASAGCPVTATTDVPPASPPPGGGATPKPPSARSTSGCGCSSAPPGVAPLLMLLWLVARRARRSPFAKGGRAPRLA